MKIGHFQKEILDNGIRVICEDIPYIKSISIGIWINKGSRDEPAEYNGISHFLEHLAFKGTKRRTAYQIAMEIDSIGGQIDAFTTREYVCFSAKVLDEHFPIAIDILADILFNSTFNPEEIENERQVILEEIKMVDDSPSDYLYDLFYRTIYGDHPFGRPIQGYSNSVKRIKREDIINYSEVSYYPENIIIAIAGNLSSPNILSLVKEYFNPLKKNPSMYKRSAPTVGTSVLFKEKDLEQVHFCIGMKGLPCNHEKKYTLYILNTILGGSMSSRLFQNIREKKGLVYSIYSFNSSYLDTGLFGISAGTSPFNLAQVIKLIGKELAILRTEPIGIDELNKVKNQLKGNLVLSLESSTSRMNYLAKQELYFGRYISLEEIYTILSEVTSESIIELSNIIFDKQYLNITVLGPAKEDDINIDWIL